MYLRMICAVCVCLTSLQAHAETLTYYDHVYYELYELDVDTGISVLIGDATPGLVSLTWTPDGLVETTGRPYKDIAWSGTELYGTTFDGYERRLWADGVDYGQLPWVQGYLAMAFDNTDLYALWYDTGPVKLYKSQPLLWDLNASGDVDDADLNILLSGSFTSEELAELLAVFGTAGGYVDMAYVTDVATEYVIDPGWSGEFTRPTDAAFVDARLFCTEYGGDILEVDIPTGELRYAGARGHFAEGIAGSAPSMSAIPEPYSGVLLVLGILILMLSRRSFMRR